MASDKLMNHTQGESIITKLTSIADSLDDLAAVTPAKLGMGIATCDTAASTAAKTAALANFALREGAPVSVQFTYANTAANATLNINNTGAKPIIYKDAAIGNDVISAGDTCTFIYTTNTYKITNIDTLTGPGSGTVRQVGAENGLITDQSDNADIQTTGKIGLNLKSATAFSAEAPNPVEIEDKLYPVALDAAGHPAVSVPGTEYTQGAGINISENNVITNTGVFDVTAPTSSDTTATNGDIKVIKKVVNNGVTTESVSFVKPKGINDPAFKALDSSTSGLTSDDNHVPTSKTVQDAIDTALASASVYKGTISAFNDLPTSTATVIVRKGWYYRVSTAWAATTGTPATHVGDIIIAEIDSPSKAIDSTNWSLLHNEANTDANVAQSPVSTNANYEVLFSGTADNTAHTEGTGKDSGLTYNPSTNKLTVSGEVSASSYSGLPEGNTTTKGIVQLGTDADKAASGNHGHGNITNGGALQTTDVSIASGDKLVITDASDSNKVARASVSFDGSTATQALTKKGTWETFNNYTHPTNAGNKHIPANGATGNYLKYGGSSGTAAWTAPLTAWPATAAHTDTLPSTKLLDDRFKTNETNILYRIKTIKIGSDSTEYNPDTETGIATIPAYPTTLPASDVSAWAKAANKPKYTASEVGAIATTAKGANGGVAELDANGKVPSSQLPSYVDDVLEYSAKSAFPATGETGKIYVDKNTNKTYRWSGSAYVEISESLALGETDSTAYRGDRGKAAYDHSKLTSGNPHNVTKSDVGLGNVGNFKAVSTVASQGLSDTEKSNARANIGAGTGNGTYSKPSGGIPKTDLASAVQTSLGVVDALSSNTYTQMTPRDGITIHRGGYIIIGKLCIVNVEFEYSPNAILTRPIFVDAPCPATEFVVIQIDGTSDGAATANFDSAGFVWLSQATSMEPYIPYDINAVFMVE